MSASESHINLENEVFVVQLINYLATLQTGRVKPNNKNNNSSESTVRDSIDNLKDINAVKDRLNFIFDVDISKTNPSRNRD